jgi:FkbM family methyltransferase
MDGALRALVRRQHGFNTVVDIGASNGQWSDLLMGHFPHCQYLLVEAQPVHAPALRSYCTRHPNAAFVLAAAGEEDGEVYFDATKPFGGQASYVPHSPADIRVPVVSIDRGLERRQLTSPFLLKFDTHGFEVPILKGAARALAATDVIIMECYNFRIGPECLTFYQMTDYLAERGFRCIDLVDVMHRPYDDSLWQMDLVFVRSDRPEFSYMSYA